MKAVEIEDEVFQALEKRVRGFGDTPNEAIKRLLAGAEFSVAERPKDDSSQGNTKRCPIVELVQSPQYLRGDSKERYFAVLRFLYESNQSHFEHFNGFRLGSRVQISTRKEEIENSGKSTHPQPLDGTPIWVMSNLSNDRKRAILEVILRDFGYTDDIIKIVLASIPDSNIRRTNRIILSDDIDNLLGE